MDFSVGKKKKVFRNSTMRREKKKRRNQSVCPEILPAENHSAWQLAVPPSEHTRLQQVLLILGHSAGDLRAIKSAVLQARGRKRPLGGGSFCVVMFSPVNCTSGCRSLSAPEVVCASSLQHRRHSSRLNRPPFNVPAAGCLLQ